MIIIITLLCKTSVVKYILGRFPDVELAIFQFGSNFKDDETNLIDIVL